MSNKHYCREFILDEEKEIIDYLNSINFTGYYKTFDNGKIEASSIDQKCTFDVLNIDCKIFLNYLKYSKNNYITINDMLNYEVAKNLLYVKTNGNGKAKMQENTKQEYDKFFSQILEMLTYAEIFMKKKSGHKNMYFPKNIQMIEKLSKSEFACIAFICHYVFLLVKDDEEIIQNLCNISKNKKNKNLINQFKTSTKKWVQIKSNNRHQKDCGQISKKIDNPLFYLWDLYKYSPQKNMSELKQGMKDLSYFRIHRRDKNKKPMLTRMEQKLQQSDKVNNQDLPKWLDVRKIVFKYNDTYKKILNKDSEYAISEYSLNYIDKNSAHVHHIFPKSYWDEKKETLFFKRDMLENLIVISPSEHVEVAHENAFKFINEKNLPEILIKQYQKITKILNLEKNSYSLENFYKLLCLIYNEKVKIPNFKNNEKIMWYIEDLLNEILNQH